MAAVQSLNSYSDLELALMILLGYFGNGQDRRNKLGARYAAAQGIVEDILRTGSVPAGSGYVSKNKIAEAVKSVFYDVINEIAEEIKDEIE